MNYIMGTLAYATPGNVFISASIVVKLLVMIMMATGLVVLITAVIRKLTSGAHSGLLSTLGGVAVVAGLLSVAYTGLTSFMAYQRVHATHLGVLLPSLIEVIYVLMLGVIIWSIALWGNAGARRA
ncbi:hypothetical protein [Asticcacaulis sp.]|uniref:hypothetical protein n=1 Tax=Asticcacaulis sp. TaxID=1872648 RepID=UPI002BEAAE31|nr:hypothetical protein [Asticcacaulis sp.]HTM83021.1 hypothetical protein [Asticcacaulis sp.]